jgi:hypothetical protein
MSPRGSGSAGKFAVGAGLGVPPGVNEAKELTDGRGLGAGVVDWDGACVPQPATAITTAANSRYIDPRTSADGPE